MGDLERIFTQPPSPANAIQDAKHRRRRQIGTMGEFLTYDYMDPHTGCVRATDSKVFLQRADEYKKSLYSRENNGDFQTPDQRRVPLPFRPSSSRMDFLLCGIGFNVHVQNLSLLSVSC